VSQESECYLAMIAGFFLLFFFFFLTIDLVSRHVRIQWFNVVLLKLLEKFMESLMPAEFYQLDGCQQEPHQINTDSRTHFVTHFKMHCLVV